MADKYDLIVLGSGPGGYVAAIRASQLGLKTAIVEREKLGGICLNWGCIPTKALLRTSEIHHYLTHAWPTASARRRSSFDLAKIVDRSRKVAGQLNMGVKGLMKKNKVTVVEGDGTITGKGKLSVTKDGKTTELAAKNIIIATGARARDLPFAKADGERIWTYRHAMVPKEMPTKLLVIGSGAIGVEFASFYSDMGAEVTIVEMLDRDPSGRGRGGLGLHAQGARQAGHDDPCRRRRREARSDRQAGVKAAIKGDDGKVDDRRIQPRDRRDRHRPQQREYRPRGARREDRPRPYRHRRLWPHQCRGHLRDRRRHRRALARAQGEPRGRRLRRGDRRREAAPVRDKSNIPGCTYSRPQVASVGLTEAKAKEAGRKVKVGKFPFIGNGKAIALGEAEGFVKTVFDEGTGELLGAHMVGAEVTELIQGYVIARQLETTEDELMHTVFPHPTLSEMMHESVLDAYGRAIHY